MMMMMMLMMMLITRQVPGRSALTDLRHKQTSPGLAATSLDLPGMSADGLKEKAQRDLS